MRSAAVAIGALVLLGACAEDEPTVETPEAAETTAPTADVETPGEGIQQAATVQLAEVGDLGEILVDENQMTLYVFLEDTANASRCEGNCHPIWPALRATGELTAGDGVEGELDTIENPNAGYTQVTYEGRPLYRYAKDEEPGDAKGQGVVGNWYVVGADGEPVRG